MFLCDSILNEANEVSVLNEGLFGPSLQEIDYVDAIKDYEAFNKKFIESVAKFPSLKGLVTYKVNVPMIFTITKKDHRTTMQQTASDWFSIRDLARESNTTENLVINDINSLFNSLSMTARYFNLTLLRDSNYNYVFYYFMDQKKCLKNILDNKTPKIKADFRDIVTEMKNNSEAVMNAIKKHPLKVGNGLRFDRSYDGKIYRMKAASGSGACLQLQDDTDAFTQKDYSFIQPRMNFFSFLMNLAYYLDSTVLSNTNLMLSAFSAGQGSTVLYLASRQNIFVNIN